MRELPMLSIFLAIEMAFSNKLAKSRAAFMSGSHLLASARQLGHDYIAAFSVYEERLSGGCEQFTATAQLDSASP